MVMQVTNLRQFRFSVAAERARLDGTVTKKYKTFVTKVFKDLVINTPQWSGHLAANWNVLLTNETEPGTYPWKIEPYSRPVYQRGDPGAVNFALGRAQPKISKIRWNTKVGFANPVEYADEVQDNPGKLRPVNLVEGKVAMARWIAQKYSRGNVVLGDS